MKDKEILNQVLNVIKQAGEEVMSFYNKDYQIKDKGNDSPVTEADLASEKIILKGLSKHDYGVLSEETEDDKARLKKERVWIIDPLDGTKDFINKTGDFTIMIALVEKSRPILGVVYQPAKDILYYAIEGKGAYGQIKDQGAKKINVSKVSDVSKARFLGSRFHKSEMETRVAKEFNITRIIPCGSIGLKAVLIASDRADINLNPSNHPQEYDICAADIILHEAGGRLTDLKGKRYKYNQDDPHIHGYVASNGIIHDQIINYLENYKLSI